MEITEFSTGRYFTWIVSDLKVVARVSFGVIEHAGQPL